MQMARQSNDAFIQNFHLQTCDKFGLEKIMVCTAFFQASKGGIQKQSHWEELNILEKQLRRAVTKNNLRSTQTCECAFTVIEYTEQHMYAKMPSVHKHYKQNN